MGITGIRRLQSRYFRISYRFEINSKAKMKLEKLIEEAESMRPKPPEPTYADKRRAEYPSFADQFDLLYHGGMDAWKAAIQAVKDKYPKE